MTDVAVRRIQPRHHGRLPQRLLRHFSRRITSGRSLVYRIHLMSSTVAGHSTLHWTDVPHLRHIHGMTAYVLLHTWPKPFRWVMKALRPCCKPPRDHLLHVAELYLRSSFAVIGGADSDKYSQVLPISYVAP